MAAASNYPLTVRRREGGYVVEVPELGVVRTGRDLTALETEVRAAILSVFAVPGPPGNVPTDEKDDRSGRGEDQFIRTTMALLLACVVLSLPITWGWQCLGEMSRLAAAIERTIEASWNRKP